MGGWRCVITVIAAFVDHDGRSAIASDTGYSTEVLQEVVAGKIVRVGAALVGLSGTALWARFLRGAEPVHEPSDVELLADAWIAWAKARGHGSVENRDFLINGRFVVLLRGRIYSVGPDGDVIEHERYTAAGAGCDVAMGVLYALSHRHPETPAEVAVTLAVEAAMAHAHGCFGRVVLYPGEGP